MKDYDVAILGGGILGSSLAYLFSTFSTNRTVLLEREHFPAMHSSTRNTGVIHRPFYLNPKTKKLFAMSANLSYFLWKEMAEKYQLPWKETETLEVALDERGSRAVHDYGRYSIQNGMEEKEFQILDGREAATLEPEVKCESAFLSKTDTNVEFGRFASILMDLSIKNGLEARMNTAVQGISDSEGTVTLLEENSGKVDTIHAKIIVNVAGGESLFIARRAGLARNYAQLHFRGDYWRVSNSYPDRIHRNIYSVPRNLKYPFLDPHFVIRPDGVRELGPNASLVTGPYGYRRDDENHKSGYADILSSPLGPKLRLFKNFEFLHLVAREWRSSTFRSAMVDRMREFIPSIDSKIIAGRGLSGIRHNLIDRDGFVPEATLIKGDSSIHVLNFNSPGATGAPAYASYLINFLEKSGFLADRLDKSAARPDALWGNSIGRVSESMNL